MSSRGYPCRKFWTDGGAYPFTVRRLPPLQNDSSRQQVNVRRLPSICEMAQTCGAIWHPGATCGNRPFTTQNSVNE